jgi:ubiquinone/menaquinone biosynthesis C-methylase UbiE
MVHPTDMIVVRFGNRHQPSATCAVGFFLHLSGQIQQLPPGEPIHEHRVAQRKSGKNSRILMYSTRRAGFRGPRAIHRLLMTANSNADVRKQYEAMPYPPRDPTQELLQLRRTWLDDLPMLNHYCFGGNESFRNGFRVLVAGGGTGDTTIFMAEQLRDTDAEIVHLDFSATSIAIAQQRAGIRGLTNIRFIHDSILNLPALDVGKFDYINCVGVLHHLADPDAGLKALLCVLKDSGAMGLMVYATYGRTGVYQMQSLMQLINANETDHAAEIERTQQILDCLPGTNWFKRGEALYGDHRNGDAGIYDLLLHPQDRAYTVGQLYEWLVDGHGLNIELTDVERGRSSYLPHLLMGTRPPSVLAAIRAMPLRRQYEIAELFHGRVQTHSFYATRSATCKAAYGDPDCIPFIIHEHVSGPELADVFARSRGQPFVLDHAHTGVSITVNPGKFGPAILRHIDGSNSFRKIFNLVRRDPAFRTLAPRDDALFADFRDIYETLNALERLLLRKV